jgi:Oxidoreductase family, NAD-binding Rossmann fold/Amidohydrolase family
MPEKLRVLVVGLGHMGVTHAKAYDRLDGYELAGLCCRSITKRDDIVKTWPQVARFADYGEALANVKPDVVSVNTWPDTHADFAVRAFQAGAHVFLEKPIAQTVADAERVVAAAEANNRKLLVGLGPRHSPTWVRFMELARGLGKPLVMRMNLNQRSIGPAWTWHKDLMKSLSPIVDCGVHYVAAAGMPDGTFEWGSRRVIKKGRRITLENRTTLAGSAITMLDAFRNLISLGLSLEQAAEMTSTRQAEYLGLQNLGRIEPGARACLVKLDEDLRLQGVWVDGESIAPAF